MNKLYILISFILIAHLSFAQNNFLLEGTVYDSITNRPIKNANIKIIGKKTGTISDSRGHFILKFDKYPLKIQISHVSYLTKIRIISNTDFVNISIPLILKTNKINQVNISAKNKILEITKNHFFDINDFEFTGDTIVLITYDWQEKLNPWIVLMNNYGDTILKKHIFYDGIFYKDCLNNLYLINDKYAYQIYISKNKIIVGKPINAKKFKKLMTPCINELKGKLYLKQYTYNEQVLSYFSADTISKNINKFKIIADKTTIRRLYDKERFYSMGVAPTDADLRFEKMCFFAPVFAPLIVINDTICIFNFVDGKIEYYNSELKFLNSVNIYFYQKRTWKKQIFTDDVTGKVYTLFQKNGITTLSLIDRNTGKLTTSIKIPSFKWISKIIIRDNIIYFLYRKTSNLELTRLYKLKIL